MINKYITYSKVIDVRCLLGLLFRVSNDCFVISFSLVKIQRSHDILCDTLDIDFCALPTRTLSHHDKGVT